MIVMPFKPRNTQEPRLSVRCIVSDRWLSFATKTGSKLQCRQPVHIWVMTRGSDDSPRTLCNLIVTREDLLDTLNQIGEAPD